MAKKQDIVYSLLCFNWIAAFFVSMISNYQLYTFLLKGAVVIFLMAFLYYDSSLSSNSSILSIRRDSTRKFSAILILAVLVPAATLLYSSNPFYGSLKLVSLIMSTLPCIAALYYIMTTFNRGRLKIFLTSLFLTALSMTVLALVLKPFSFISPYSFSLTNWSHVLFARFVSIAALILLILHFNLKKNSNIYISGIFIFILFTGVTISGHKASILGLLIAAVLLMFYKSIYLSKFRKQLLIAFIAISLSVVASAAISGGEESLRRTTTIIQPEKLMAESGVQQRLAIWDIAFKVGNENIPIGTGLGGFNTEENLGTQYLYIKYPHNAPLEIYTELGIVPLILFIILLLHAGKIAFKVRIELLLLIFYFIWLSLFSKDISTNTQLWFLIVLLVISNADIKNIKESLTSLLGRNSAIS